MERSVLAGVTLFAGLAAEELAGLAAHLHRRRYAKGQVVFVQGDPGTSLYVIEEGRVRISRVSPDGRELVLAVLGPGDFFGEMSLLDGEPRSADAAAQDDCQLLLLPREGFLRFVERHPQMALRLLAVVSRRLRYTDQVAEDVAFLDVPARLARALITLAGCQDEPAEEAVAVPGRLTQAELAGMVGATRESINRWLAFYQRKGLIQCRQGRITILRPAELRKRVY